MNEGGFFGLGRYQLYIFFLCGFGYVRVAIERAYSHVPPAAAADGAHSAVPPLASSLT
jgi:hypothetical protein